MTTHDLHNKFKTSMGRLLTALFMFIALFMIGLAIHQFINGLAEGKEIISVLIKSINTSIVALAIFELGIGIGKEYGNSSEEKLNTYQVIRRTIARFVGTVCIALVLEALIMIIKYSQLDLAGNLFYPVGILIGSSVLLMSMGIFLHLTRKDCPEQVSPLHLGKESYNQPVEGNSIHQEKQRSLRRI